MTKLNEPAHGQIRHVLAQGHLCASHTRCSTGHSSRNRLGVRSNLWCDLVSNALGAGRANCVRRSDCKTRRRRTKSSTLGTQSLNSSLRNLDATRTLQVVGGLLSHAKRILVLTLRLIKLNSGLFASDVAVNDGVDLDLKLNLLTNNPVVGILKLSSPRCLKFRVDTIERTKDLKRVGDLCTSKTVDDDGSIRAFKRVHKLLCKPLLNSGSSLARLVLHKVYERRNRSHALCFVGSDEFTTEGTSNVFNVYERSRRNASSSRSNRSKPFSRCKEPFAKHALNSRLRRALKRSGDLCSGEVI